MSEDGTDEDLGEQLDRKADDIRDFFEKNSPRPSVDAENADRLLEEAPPARASDELHKMVDGFRSGAGAASGRNSTPAPEDAPTEDLPRPDPPAEVPPPG
jgi:type II secretory pathway component PulK